LPQVLELHLFRIIQEAVNNITKHARAKLVKLQVQIRDESVLLRIQDDGHGFDPIAAEKGKKSRHGLGLTNMRERALAMNGECEIKSQRGEGTTIIVRVPLSGLSKGRKKDREKNSSKKPVGNSTKLEPAS
jgi:two-component system sensor histidine kinase DegS